MTVSPTSAEQAKAVRSSVIVSAIGKFDNWDKRECAVDEANVGYWRAEVANYLALSPPNVPKHIHQIWIGTREPPCVWLDTWRVNFMADASKEWCVCFGRSSFFPSSWRSPCVHCLSYALKSLSILFFAVVAFGSLSHGP
jgi:hypothetical protein